MELQKLCPKSLAMGVNLQQRKITLGFGVHAVFIN